MTQSRDGFQLPTEGERDAVFAAEDRGEHTVDVGGHTWYHNPKRGEWIRDDHWDTRSLDDAKRESRVVA